MYKGNGKKKKPSIQANNEYVRERREEFALCRTPECRNAIANWARGPASNGYCATCRKTK